MFQEIGFAPRCAALRGFLAEISQTVEATVKSDFLPTRVELFGPVKAVPSRVTLDNLRASR